MEAEESTRLVGATPQSGGRGGAKGLMGNSGDWANGLADLERAGGRGWLDKTNTSITDVFLGSGGDAMLLSQFLYYSFLRVLCSVTYAV